ncbi:reticulophagy regulator 3 isoform X1 [Hemiscyllium ocellatum]|uniref:reticulophagy regulator 3 isoform X1 n=1 Tax=Hemiscyllium ocellatum TaxID=170820 RepID=UPI002966D431|nr:reticulophagy regulator 3 isoform X1 [Hemiscyllium ocellatum]
MDAERVNAGPEGSDWTLASAPTPGSKTEPDQRLRQQQLLRILGHYEPVLTYWQSLLVWERPLHSLLLYLSVNASFWFLALTSLRLVFLTAFGLIIIVCADTWKTKIWPELQVMHMEDSDAESYFFPCSWGLVHPKLLSVPELCHRMADLSLSAERFLKNLYHFKKQNPGKFCLLVCGVFTFLAVIGRYIPGLFLSYISLIGILFWPLASYHQLGLKINARIEPVLKRLDFSMKGYMLAKQQERQLRRRAPAVRTADDGSDSEAELAAFCPKLDDSIIAKELEISDSEHSDTEVSYADNGTFNLSRGQTPITDGSEDLDRHSDPEESFARDLPEFPSINPNVAGLDDDDDDTSLGIPTAPYQASAQEDVSLFSDQEDIDVDISLSGLPSPLNFTGSQGLTLAGALASNMMAAALSGADREAQMVRDNPPRFASQTYHEHSGTEMDTDAEGDDFELLDQSELNQYENITSQDRASRQHSKAGFLSNFLRKQ